MSSQQFKAIDIESLTENPFKLIGQDWMLITAGTMKSYNTMTASWGGLGVMWNLNICFCMVRPQRYTYEFMEKHEHFSLSFFDRSYRDKLDYCGSVSGRDVDKASACGFTLFEVQPGIVSFAESRLILACKKIYFQDLDPARFLDARIPGLYPKQDYHRLYIGEVIGCHHHGG